MQTTRLISELEKSLTFFQLCNVMLPLYQKTCGVYREEDRYPELEGVAQ